MTFTRWRTWGLTGSLLCWAAAAGAATGTDLALGYAGIREGAGNLLHGAAFGVAAHVGSALDVTGELSFYGAQGATFGLLLAGPRFRAPRDGRVTPFAHVLAGLAFERETQVFVAYPGAGLEIGTRDGRRALRLQLDWPLISRAGLHEDVPRASVAVVLRLARR